jgi:hypothetical protein
MWEKISDSRNPMPRLKLLHDKTLTQAKNIIQVREKKTKILVRYNLKARFSHPKTSHHNLKQFVQTAFTIDLILIL